MMLREGESLHSKVRSPSATKAGRKRVRRREREGERGRRGGTTVFHVETASSAPIETC